MFQLNYREEKPIYEQIKEGVRRMVILGGAEVNSRLPSIRELATQMSINPNTIQRAYRELENEGYIYTVAGKGSFVAPRSGVDSRRREALLQSLEASVRELLYLGVDVDWLLQRVREIAEGKGGESRDQDGAGL